MFIWNGRLPSSATRAMKARRTSDRSTPSFSQTSATLSLTEASTRKRTSSPSTRDAVLVLFVLKQAPHCRGRVPKGVAATQRRSREGAQRREVTMSVGYSGAGEQERPDCLGAVRKIAFRYISHEPPRHSLAQLLERGAPRADKDNADNPSEHIASMQRVRTSR